MCSSRISKSLCSVATSDELIHTLQHGVKLVALHASAYSNIMMYDNPYQQQNAAYGGFPYYNAMEDPSRGFSLVFCQELLQYEMQRPAMIPNVRKYNRTTDHDNHVDTYEWTMISLCMDEMFTCTQKDGESIGAYYDRCTLATLGVPSLALLPKASYKACFPRKCKGGYQELETNSNSRWKNTYASWKGEERKEANLKTPMRAPPDPSVRTIATTSNTCICATRLVYSDPSENTTNGATARRYTRAKYCEYQKSKTHDTYECTQLKRKIDEKQLKANPSERARNLRVPHDVFLPYGPMCDGSIVRLFRRVRIYRTLAKNLLNMTFSMDDPMPQNWNPKDPLLVDEYFHDIKVYRVYIDIGAETNNLYDYFFH
ncbi:hypothetical protein LXL04_015560 [Taraxacum kok-saghyz]